MEWNDTKRNVSQFCLHQLFEAQVERTPGRVALALEDQQLTYRELNARANQLANYLRRLGVGPETLVCLYTDRSLEMVAGLIGILKAGGAYLPIDPSYAKDRIGFMLEDAQARIVLTQEALRASLAGTQASVVCLDKEWGVMAGESPENLSVNTFPDNLAYVIYTSDATGKPKGCRVTHSNAVRMIQALEPMRPFGTCDVWALFLSLAVDSSSWEIEATLRQHPAVREALVALDDRGQEKRRVAYIVPRAFTPTTAELRSFLGGKLPDSMIPSEFVMLQAASSIPNGKLDQHVSPAPGAEKPATGSGFVAPRTAMQMDLAKIWQESMGVKRVGIGENFFDIGGDSLSAMRIVVRMRRLLNLDVAVACLFENPTIESLALAVEGMQSPMHSEEELLRMLEEIDALPLSSAESDSGS